MTEYNVEQEFCKAVNAVQATIYNDAVAKGWYEEKRNVGEQLCLIHSEISEALEALRAGHPPSEKIEGHSNFTEELADAVIRIMDLCGSQGVDLADAIVKKIAFNKTRPHRHGKKF